MNLNVKNLCAASTLALLAGCAGLTGTVENSFGDSVRQTVAAQALNQGGPLAADEPLQHTDGRRMENVQESTYRTLVGDPRVLVRDYPVETRGKDE